VRAAGVWLCVVVDKTVPPPNLSNQVKFFVRFLEFFLQSKNSSLKFHVLAAEFKNLLVERSDTFKKFGVG
jgi:hypothetical protein